MCFNFQTSLVGWMIAQCMGIWLWVRNRANDRWNAIFLMTFSQVQLIEALIWWTRSSPTKNYDWILGFILMLALWAQPLSQTLGAYFSTSTPILVPVIWMYGCLCISAIYLSLRSTFSFSESPDHHLIWHRHHLDQEQPFLGPMPLPMIYFLGLFLGLFWMRPYTSMISLLVFGMISIEFLYLVSSPEAFSSMWCLICVAYGAVAIAL